MSCGLRGAGTLLVGSVVSLDYGAGGCFRGAVLVKWTRYRIALSQRTRSAIAVRAQVAREPPWPSTDYRLTFVIDRGRLKLRSPQPRLTGRSVVRIRLSTRPRTAPFFNFLNFGTGAVLRPTRELPQCAGSNYGSRRALATASRGSRSEREVVGRRRECRVRR